MKHSYLTVDGMNEVLFIEKASKFYGFCKKIKTANEAKLFVQELLTKHPKSRHCCYAYKLGIENQDFRIEDDGEPSGTAGKLIYGQIESFGLTNVIVAVIRYFGGVKLGTSGLIKAYKTTAKNCLENAKIQEIQVKAKYQISTDDEHMYKIIKIAKHLNLDYEDLIIDLQSSINILVPLSIENILRKELKKHLDNIDSWDESMEFQLKTCKVQKLEILL
ncbi:MAG: YigZ family protein [Saprospiraceae bacterium]